MWTSLISSIALVATPPLSGVESLIEGRWRIDVTRGEQAGKPITRLLKNGVYECQNCITPYQVRADGRFHQIAGGMDVDAVSVRVLDTRTVEFRYRKKGRLVETAVERVSARGDTLTYQTTDLTAPNGTPVVEEGERSRVGPAPVGAHPVSGEWRLRKQASLTEAALILDVRRAGDSVTMVQPTGRQFTAKLDGPPVPIVGDEAGRMIKLVTEGPRALRLVTTVAGEVVNVGVMTVSDDGRSLIYEARDLKLGQTARFVATKQ